MNAEFKLEGGEARIPCSILLSDKSRYDIKERDIEEWNRRFTEISVRDVLCEIKEWNDANSMTRKTRRGVRAHVERWLQAANADALYGRRQAEKAAEENRPRKSRFK